MTKKFDGGSDHHTMPETLEAARGTYLGQAHFAGTGPENTTCRQCVHWGNKTQAGEWRGFDYADDGMGMMALEPAKCHYPIMNKAARRVPPQAGSCAFYSERFDPPDLVRKRRRKKRNAE